MKKTFLVLSAFLAGAPVFAADSYKCDPSRENAYFTEEVALTVLGDNAIRVNGVDLELDPNYKPTGLKGFTRYLGDTETATGWIDSGEVEVLVKKTSGLVGVVKFRVRGETFISETFSCQAER